MSDTTTPNLGLTLPAIGGSADSWGAKLNTNFSSLDSKLANRSLASPGWRMDIDGTIENWGLITTNSAGVATFFFGKPFPTSILTASATPHLGSNFWYTASLGNWTNSSIEVFSMQNGSPTACGVFVWALGH